MQTIYKKQRKNPKIKETGGLRYIYQDELDKACFQHENISNKNISNKELSEELHKPIIKKFRERTVESPLVDNILGADPTDMQLITKFKEGICFSLCLIDAFSKYVWLFF